MRVGRVAVILLAFAFISSCGLFLMPKVDRENPLDPDNVFTKVELTPTLDGYVDSGGYQYFLDMSLRVSEPVYGEALALLQFDPAAVPADVAYATLVLNNDSAGYPLTEISVARIVQAWTASVTYTTISPDAFIDAASASLLTVPANVQGEFSVDVTDIVKQWAADPATNYGMRLKSNYGYQYFWASEAATGQRPVLRIQY